MRPRTPPMLVAGLGALCLLAVGSVASAAQAPVDKTPPKISGNPQEGQVLVADHGRWKGDGLTFRYQWFHCDGNGGACNNVNGANDVIYTPTSEDIGRTIKLTVTATDQGGASAQASSDVTGQVAPAANGAPRSTSLPSVTGNFRRGSLLTAHAGGWTGSTLFGYTWRRCSADGGGCSNIAFGPTYRPGADDVGQTLRVLVAARNGVGKSFVLSNASPKITPISSGHGAPRNLALPSISGTVQEGSIVTAAPGTWRGTQPMQFSYQWKRCGANGFGCVNVDGATDLVYALRAADVGHRMRVEVVARNQDGRGSAVSSSTNAVAPAPASQPTNTSPPSLSGTPQEGSTLTADAGTWSGTAPIQFAYRWRRCDSAGGNCTDTSTTSPTYTLASADVGHSLRVVVTASNAAGSNAAVSNPSSVVTAKSSTGGGGLPDGAIRLPNGLISIPITSVALPQRLIVDQVVATPSRITSRSEPLQVRFRVVDTRGYVVRDALVYAVGVPFDRLSKAPEVTSGTDGWATVTFQVLPTFQLRPGNLVVIFVRARKPGDSVLAGVSTRRLVSVRVG